jgi:hypothetical protein
VPPPRQVYSRDTDQILLTIPDPVGLFWVEWKEDDRPDRFGNTGAIVTRTG